MKVVIIAPPVSDSGVSIFPRHPPLLAALLAASVRQTGAEVAVLDAFLENLSVDDSLERIDVEHPDLVVLMPNDVARETPAALTAEICRRYRRKGGKAVLLAAGVGSSAWMTGLVRDAPYLDGAVAGDPEEAVSAIVLSMLEGSGDWRDLPYVISRSLPGKPPAEAVVEDLDRLPYPAWDLIPPGDYVVLPHRRLRGVEYPILASRGCYWNRCRFCQDLACVKSSLYRIRSPEAVVAEMRAAVLRHDSKHFLFHDAVFPTRKDWMERFAACLSSSGLDCTWFCMARADSVSPEVLALMKSAGCTNVCYGLETGSEELLLRMDKGHSLEDSRVAVRWTREAGMDVSATFIFGFPGETIEMAARTVDFALGLNIDYAQFLLVKWHQAPEHEPEEGTLMDEWELTQYDYRGMVFVPRAYGSLSRLKFVRSYAYARFYLRPGYLLRTAARVRSVSELKRYALGGLTLISAMLNR